MAWQEAPSSAGGQGTLRRSRTDSMASVFSMAVLPRASKEPSEMQETPIMPRSQHLTENHHHLPIRFCLCESVYSEHCYTGSELRPCLTPVCGWIRPTVWTNYMVYLLVATWTSYSPITVKKPLSYYLPHGVTGRYLHHTHRLHPLYPTLSGLPKPYPTPPNPTHHKPQPH